VTVRSRRNPAPPPPRGPVVAVTGAATGLGRALVERLAARDDLQGLVGLDRSVPRMDGVVWRACDVLDPVLAARLRGADTVVHLATTYDAALPAAERRATNVRGTELVLQAARAAGASRVVLTTSADVWGAVPGRRVPLPDASPAAGGPDDTALVGDHVEVERLAAQVDGLRVTVLRPAVLVGGSLGRAYDGVLLRQLLTSPRLLAVRGIEPQWQLCHTDDLLAALELAALGRVEGPLGVGCDGALPQSRVETVSGRRRLELPAEVALATAERLHRSGVSTASPRELDHLLAPLVVAADGLRAAGWVPGWTNESALAAYLADRRGDGRTGAVTAAGATVALMGTAALVRRVRRSRRGR